METGILCPQCKTRRLVLTPIQYHGLQPEPQYGTMGGTTIIKMGIRPYGDLFRGLIVGAQDLVYRVECPECDKYNYVTTEDVMESTP